MKILLQEARGLGKYGGLDVRYPLDQLSRAVQGGWPSCQKNHQMMTGFSLYLWARGMQGNDEWSVAAGMIGNAGNLSCCLFDTGCMLLYENHITSVTDR